MCTLINTVTLPLFMAWDDDDKYIHTNVKHNVYCWSQFVNWLKLWA